MSWPVAVVRPDLVSMWKIYHCGMVEFLRRVFTREFDANPLGDSGMWDAGSGRFLHWREEQRLWDEGIDPWTGEPDPYAGMTFD
ncbi:hypothetical protein ACWEFL_20675 [Streptomyces sp. NPDC004838]